VTYPVQGNCQFFGADSKALGSICQEPTYPLVVCDSNDIQLIIMARTHLITIFAALVLSKADWWKAFLHTNCWLIT